MQQRFPRGIIPKELAAEMTEELFDQAVKAAFETIGGMPGDLSMLNGCIRPGTEQKPLKTPQMAMDNAKDGNSIMLMPGTYSVTNLNIKPYVRLLVTANGVILKATPDSHSALAFQSGTSERIVKDITVDGGINQGILIKDSGKVYLQGVKVINTGATGIRVLNTQMDIKNCEIAYTVSHPSKYSIYRGMGRGAIT